MTEILILIIGFVLLIYGADLFVDGASSLALNLKIPQIVIGLTIVAFGTSAPELAVNVFAALQKNGDLTLGNVVGSNILNIALILGLTAVIRPLSIQRNTTLIEVPLAVLSAIALLVVGSDVYLDNQAGQISKSEGIILLLFFCIFLVYTILISLSDKSENQENPKYNILKSSLFGFIGLALLVAGGRLIVDSATAIAISFEVPQRIIALTIVSLGTSLPELATSVIAARKGNVDLAVGNIVGSNIFNAFFIMGVSTVIFPVSIVAENNFDLLINILVSVILFIFIFTGKGRNIDRKEGVALLLLYAGYLGMLIAG